MYLTEVIVVAIGLSMDTFAVSMASGLCRKSFGRGVVLRAIFSLAVFQAGFAAIGWRLGIGFQHLIANFDHWVAFVLLAAIGGKMIWEALQGNKTSQTFDITNWYVLLGISVATSIDALIVGMGLGMLATSILESALVIGVVTLCFAAAGFIIARRFGLRALGKKAEVLGGLVLIAIGTKILFEHLH